MQCKNCGRVNLPEARFCDSCGSPLVATVAEEPRQPEAMPARRVEYAGFWLRLVAILVDGIILTALEALVWLGSILSGRGLLFGPGSFLLWFSGVLYLWLFTGLLGQTPGKMLLHLKVVRQDGTKVGMGGAALREILGRWLSVLLLLIGYLWIAWDKKKQGWHDKVAGTIVIRT